MAFKLLGNIFAVADQENVPNLAVDISSVFNQTFYELHAACKYSKVKRFKAIKISNFTVRNFRHLCMQQFFQTHQVQSLTGQM